MTTVYEVTTAVRGIDKMNRMDLTLDPPAVVTSYRTTLENGTILFLPDHTLDIGQAVTLTVTTGA